MDKIYTKFLRHFIIAAILSVSMSGCLTTRDDLVGVQARQREDAMIIRDDIRRIEGKIEGSEIETRRMAREMESLRAALTESRSRNAELENRITALQARIDAVDAARRKDKEDVVNQLSARMGELIKRTARAPATSGQGYEHVIRQGETLSEIAAAYGVRAQVIVEANNIKNPDLLVVGQKLFIPK